MSITIETFNLTREYQTYIKPEGLMNSIKGFFHRQYEVKVALAPTSLHIEGGQIVGLVGANGAGKTTLLKLLSGLIHPTSGSARVLGYVPWERSNEFLRRISILLGQKNQLWWDIPPADSFDLLARIYDLDRNLARQRMHYLAERLSCTDQLHIQLRRLSLGERMKMEIIGSLLHEPEVLFLDEPTIGLDIVAQNSIRTFLAEYVREKKPTIILTSHYMDDIALLADRLLLIQKGAIVYDGTVTQFIAKAKTTQKITIKLVNPLSHAPNINGVARDDLIGLDLITLEAAPHAVGDALAQILAQAQVLDLKIEETNFEDVIHRFLEQDLGGRKARHSVTI